MPPRFISALTVVQLLVVFLGVTLTGSFLRLHRLSGSPPPGSLGFMRDYGFWFALLPLGWALVSTLSVRRLDRSPTARSPYAVAGFILLAVLIIIFYRSASGAFRVAFSLDSQQIQIKWTHRSPTAHSLYGVAGFILLTALIFIFYRAATAAWIATFGYGV